MSAEREELRCTAENPTTKLRCVKPATHVSDLWTEAHLAYIDRVKVHWRTKEQLARYAPVCPACGHRGKFGAKW